MIAAAGFARPVIDIDPNYLFIPMVKTFITSNALKLAGWLIVLAAAGPSVAKDFNDAKTPVSANIKVQKKGNVGFNATFSEPVASCSRCYCKGF